MAQTSYSYCKISWKLRDCLSDEHLVAAEICFVFWAPGWSLLSYQPTGMFVTPRLSNHFHNKLHNVTLEPLLSFPFYYKDNNLLFNNEFHSLLLWSKCLTRSNDKSDVWLATEHVFIWIVWVTVPKIKTSKFQGKNYSIFWREIKLCHRWEGLRCQKLFPVFWHQGLGSVWFYRSQPEGLPGLQLCRDHDWGFLRFHNTQGHRGFIL